MSLNAELEMPPVTAPTIVLRGDTMAALHTLSQLPNVLASRPQPGRPFRRRAIRAVATGIDTSADAALTARGLKSRLRREILSTQRQCEWLPHLKHVIFVIAEPPHLHESAVLDIADGFAERTHAHLERVCGAYVTVTVLLVADCAQPGLLAERINQRASLSPFDPYLVLPWRDVAEQQIQQTAAATYC
ncbi:hypothetical protein [Cryobacterium sp. PAMC25264]|uniref:hypothetical protein n=1 Tax=Cryobacterium sp. PAMC25264 TaxID=2861288 RepID=UPI001C63A501|nr:hypothetical protein [Cryobacterium sp. PAMC25264]QYF73991.1 hypothetical protein KY500_01660 [Cryobacterium sp. PAMC25264]